MPRTATLTAATGTSRVPITTHGDKPGMGDDESARRAELRRDLTREVRRLMQHAGHLSVDELTTLESIVDDLIQIHTDDEACIRLARRHGDRSPAWGTRYASAVERAYHAVRDAFREK